MNFTFFWTRWSEFLISVLRKHNSKCSGWKWWITCTQHRTPLLFWDGAIFFYFFLGGGGRSALQSTVALYGLQCFCVLLFFTCCYYFLLEDGGCLGHLEEFLLSAPTGRYLLMIPMSNVYFMQFVTLLLKLFFFFSQSFVVFFKALLSLSSF